MGSDGVCTACIAGCKTCSDATACTKCNNNMFLNTEDNICYATCPGVK